MVGIASDGYLIVLVQHKEHYFLSDQWDANGNMVEVIDYVGLAGLLVRWGVLRIDASAGRRLRQVQEQARLKRRGLWRYGDPPPSDERPAMLAPSRFPWWQG